MTAAKNPSNRKLLITLSAILALVLLLSGSTPVAVPGAAPLTTDRVDPSVAMAIEAGQASVSVIVQASDDAAALKRAIARVGGEVEVDFWIIESALTTLSPQAIRELSADPAVQYIALNRTTQVSDAPPPVAPTIDNSTPGEGTVHDIDLKEGLVSVRYPHPLDVGIDQVHARNVLGRGVTIAFVDTGLSTQGKLGKLIEAGFKKRFIGQVDFMKKKPRVRRQGHDNNGHGTHVAGLVWNVLRDRDSGTFLGGAPGARILMLKALDENGQGQYKDAIAAIQWAIEKKDRFNIRVMNLSLYAESTSPYWADPLDRAVEAAWRAGIVVVVATGNDGPDPFSVTVPGNDPYVITVGALDGKETAGNLADDTLTEYSSAGPTLDLFVKPDLVAPGHKLVSFLAPGSKLAKDRPDHAKKEHWLVMNGTSTATPIVSSIAALILEQHPHLSPDQVKYRLTASAAAAMNPDTGEPVYSIWQQGAGRAWAPEAVFGDYRGAANQGLDIDKDLAGEEHYQGWTTWDEEDQCFAIEGGGYTTWTGGYTTWTGGYTTWTGGYTTWTGGYTTWTGGTLSAETTMGTGRWIPD
jgi:serine protease AprX